MRACTRHSPRPILAEKARSIDSHLPPIHPAIDGGSWAYSRMSNLSQYLNLTTSAPQSLSSQLRPLVSSCTPTTDPIGQVLQYCMSLSPRSPTAGTF